MIVDGRAIAQKIYSETAKQVADLSRTPIMAAITCAPNFDTCKYLELKKSKASEVGISLRVIELPEATTTKEAVECVTAVASQVDGIVVQLPFPSHVDRETVLASVPKEKDPDGFSYVKEEGSCLPPVVGAVVAIAKEYQVDFANKKIVVLGQGRLVGSPMTRYLNSIGADVTSLTEASPQSELLIKEADIIITGIGRPSFVTKKMVKEGVVVFDAGTSEDGGVVVGDVHPDVADHAALFTPVPGGIGPITIAVLLNNQVSLVR